MVSDACISYAGDTVEVIDDEDYVFSRALFNPNLSYQWFLNDTNIIPTAPYPYSGYYSLLGIARHEFGHGMGLRHVLNPTDLMYPIVQPNLCNVIHTDDEQGGLYELISAGGYLSPCFIPNPQYQSLLVCTASTSGIADVGSTNNIRAYPNPFDQTITIEADIGTSGKLSIDLFDILGQKTISDNSVISDTHFQKTLSTVGLSNGAYFVMISINGFITTFKLIKN